MADPKLTVGRIEQLTAAPTSGTGPFVPTNKVHVNYTGALPGDSSATPPTPPAPPSDVATTREAKVRIICPVCWGWPPIGRDEPVCSRCGDSAWIDVSAAHKKLVRVISDYRHDAASMADVDAALAAHEAAIRADVSDPEPICRQVSAALAAGQWGDAHVLLCTHGHLSPVADFGMDDPVTAAAKRYSADVLRRVREAVERMPGDTFHYQIDRGRVLHILDREVGDVR